MNLDEWRDANPFRVWRRSEGLTVADTAAKLGVARSTLNNWELGRNTPGLEALSKMDWLMPEDGLFRLWVDWMETRPN